MSLLMEALRKAEHAKRNKEAPSEGTDDFGRQEPVLPQPGQAAPDSEPTLEPLDLPFDTARTDTPSASSPEAGLAFDSGARHAGTDAASPDDVPMSIELQEMEPSAAQTEAPPASSAAALSIEAAAPAPEPVAPIIETAAFVPEQAAPPPVPARDAYAPAAEQPAAPASRSNTAKEPDLKAEQRQAKTVFSSKQTSPMRRTSALIAAAIVICAALAVYGYLQLDKLGHSNVAANLPAPAPAAAPPAPQADAVPQDTTAAAAAPAEAAAPAVVAAMPAASVSSQPRDAAPTRHETLPAASPVPPAEPTAASSFAADTPAKSKAPQKPPVDVRIIKNTPQTTINPLLTAAYDAFVAGDLDAAATSYRSVLQQDPNDRDALLGMATIAVRRDRAEEAEAFYGRLLELDPRDADAIAGMADLKRGDSAREESRLKTALAQHPQSGPILFALGNLYAQRSNWAEAQQYYFRAYGAQPNNAGYAFNLAVSLDRLSQPKLAIQYYEAALNGVQSEPLNTAAIRKRINTLKGAVAP